MRQGTYRVETDAVQGEGSYVVLCKLPYGKAKEAFAYINGDAPGSKADEVQFTESMVVEAIVEWNWTDEHGTPIPIPKETADLNALTAEEVNFLVGKIIQQGSKN